MITKTVTLRASYDIGTKGNNCYAFLISRYFSPSGALLHDEISDTFTIPYRQVSELFQQVENNPFYSCYFRSIYIEKILIFAITKHPKERTPTK